MEKVRITGVWVYSTLAFMSFGGMLATIITRYPNWIHKLPESLTTTNEFYHLNTFWSIVASVSLLLLIPAFFTHHQNHFLRNLNWPEQFRKLPVND